MALLLTAAALAGPVQAQTDDRSYLTALLEDNLSGAGRKVTITGFSGALSSQATLQQLTIADDQGVWLTLTDVVLDWSRASLLSGAFVVSSLTAGEIVLERLPVNEDLPAPEAKPFALPDLPLSVDIGEISAQKIVLGESVLGEPLEAGITASMQLAGGEGQGRLVLQRTDGKEARIALVASYANESGQLAIDLQAVEGADGVAVRKLGIPGAPSAELTIKGEGPVTDFAADVALRTDDVDRLTGSVTLTGDDAGNQGFAANLSGDLAPVFLPQYAEFFGPAVQILAQGNRTPQGALSLSEFRLQARALDLSGRVDIAADGLPARFDIAGKVGLPDGAPLMLPLPGETETRIGGATLTLGYDAATGEVWTAKADVIGLDRVDFKADRLQLTGSGRIARTPAAVDGLFDFVAAGLRPADPALAAALGPDVSGAAKVAWERGSGVTRITGLSLKGQDYDVAVDGSVAGLGTGFNLSGTGVVNFADLSRFSDLAGRPLRGAGTATVSGTGSPLSGQFDVDAKVQGTDLQSGVAQLDGLLRGLAVVDASVRRDETGTTLRSATLQARTLTVSAQGKLATGANALTADLDFRDLSVLGAAYRGSVAGKATLTGDRVTVDVTGQDLGIGQAQADRLLAGQSVLSAAAVLGDTLVLDRVSLRNPQVTVEGTGRFGATRMARAEGTLADLSVLGPGFGGALSGTVELDGDRVVVAAVGQGLAIGQTEADRLLAGTSRVAVTLRLSEGGLQIEAAEVANPQLTAKATGSVEGAVRRLAVDARLGNLGLLLPEFPGSLTVTGTAVDDGAGLTLDLRGQGPGQIDAAVNGRVAGRTADLAIRGTAQAALANAFLGSRSVSGPVRFDLSLRGPLALGSLGGTVSLDNGRLADPALNFALQDVTARATLGGGSARIEVTSGVSSGGRLAVRGTVGLTRPNTADLALDLSQVTLRDPDLYATTINGAMTVRGPLAGGADIAGRLALTETEVRVPSTGFAGVDDLPGLEHRREPAPVRATRARAGLLGGGANGAEAGGGAAFGLNLQISAPNRVFVRGRGLDAELGGQLTLTGTTADIIPFGAFNLIRGRLDILGKRLVLSEALLQLEGALVPYLSVKASNESDGYVTSVQIDGPADDPVISFTSSPDLPEEEVLARLLFGQGLQNLSAFQAAQLASAVATLAGRSGEGLVSRLRTSSGLDNLDVRTDAAGAASVTAGKYLSEKVYTEVTVGQEGKTRIDLNLDLSRNVTVKAGSDSEGETGIGIFLEKDY